jgi:hypothetical protein
VDFTIRDNATASKVAIVNQALATQLGSDGGVGQTIYMHERNGKATPLTVVAIAHNARTGSVWEEPQPRIYLPDLQSPLPAEYVVVRSNLRPAEVAAAIRQNWGGLEPGVSAYGFHTAAESVDLFLMPQRVAAGIFGAFGMLAIVLASVGLYSLLAYSVARQRREIGIRIAIGAQPGAVMAGVLARSLRLTAAGLVVGCAVSFVVMRLLAVQVKEVSPFDSVTYLSVAVLLTAITCVAAVVPARRAMSVDPLTAIRED